MCVHVCKARARLVRGEYFSGGRGFRMGGGGAGSHVNTRQLGGMGTAFSENSGAVSREDESRPGAEPPGQASPTHPRAAPAPSPPPPSPPSKEPSLHGQGLSAVPPVFSDQAEVRAAQSAGSACEHCLQTWPLPSAKQYLSSARGLSGAGTGGWPCSMGAEGQGRHSRISSLVLSA